jgi:hydrogenase maturation protease
MKTRLLCLGNDLIADDAVGIHAAEALRKAFPAMEICESFEAGFHLMDYLMDVDRVIVVDAIQTGREKPGTVYHVRREDLSQYQGSSPHYVGLFESLQLGETLGLSIAKDLQIIAIETEDCVSLGAPMTEAVNASIPNVVRLVSEILST